MLLSPIGTEPQKLPQLLIRQYDKLTADKENGKYVLTLQNLGNYDIYIENGEDATVSAGYKLNIQSEVEIVTKNIHLLSFVSDGGINDNVRIITN